MSFLLATCTVIDVLRGDNSSIIKLKSLSPIQVNISSITGFELVYGTEKASKRSIDVIKSMLVEINIINFGSKEAHEVASIRYNLRKSGSPIGLYDVPIGATAMINNLTLVTSKVNEFKRIPGLNIENWRASG